jgi:hypothetical protein
VLTIFAVPKAFKGKIATIQTNAIRSWTLLRPKCEIILFGNDEGTAGIAAKFGLRHVPGVELNEYGTPLVNSMFSLAQDLAGFDSLCYVNADIILLSDFIPAVLRLKTKPYLMIGQRWDLDVNEPVNFENPEWEMTLRAHLKKEGRLHSTSGIDYYAFPRGLYHDIPPFAIGRTGWDNWLVYNARKSGARLVDATTAVTIVHQNHDYSHSPLGEAGVWKGPESQRNVELMGAKINSFTTEYATDLLTSQGLKPALSLRHIYFRMRAVPALHPRLGFLFLPFKAIEKVFRRPDESGR